MRLTHTHTHTHNSLQTSISPFNTPQHKTSDAVKFKQPKKAAEKRSLCVNDTHCS